MSLNSILEQKLTNLAEKELQIELEPLDSRGIYVNPHQDTITRKEIWKNVANRIIHSRKYTLFYTFVIILSLIVLITSFNTKCLTTVYLLMDYFINISLIVEVLLRINALGKNYWRSFLNIIDLIIVPLCIITLIYLTVDDCSNRQGKIADNIILGVRNGLQLFRLILLFKNNDPFTLDVEKIDFGSIDDNQDVDLISEIISDGTTVDTGAENMDFLIEYEEFEKELAL